MNKPELTVLMNIPTPYQLDYFKELNQHFKLSVIYYSKIEKNRLWNLNIPEDYTTTILKNPGIVTFIQKILPSFHFNPKIISYLLKDKSPYIIIGGSYNSPNAILGMLISKIKRKKVLFLGEAISKSSNPLKKIVKKILLLPLHLLTDAIIGIGSKSVESHKEWGYSKPIHNIPYSISGANFEKQNLDPQKLSNLEDQYDKKNSKIFLFSGSIITRKGVDILLEVFARVSSNFPESKLLILGEGELKNNYMKQTSNYKNIHWLGFKEKEDIPYYFNISDIFLFPSRYDGWGLVINEACASGLAIIGSEETGAVRDMIQEGINGFSCKATDISCFISKAELLLKDPLLLEKIKKQSKSSYVYFDAKTAARRSFEVII